MTTRTLRLTTGQGEFQNLLLKFSVPLRDGTITQEDPARVPSILLKEPDKRSSVERFNNPDGSGELLVRKKSLRTQGYAYFMQTEVKCQLAVKGSPLVLDIERVGLTEDMIYIEMKSMDNGTMETLLMLSENKIPEPSQEYLMIQVAAAICWIHSKRVVQRDIKPANIFIDENGRVRIGDFDLGYIWTYDYLMKSACGTLLWAHPHIFTRGNKPLMGRPDDTYDPVMADIFGWAALLWAMLDFWTEAHQEVAKDIWLDIVVKYKTAYVGDEFRKHFLERCVAAGIATEAQTTEFEKSRVAQLALKGMDATSTTVPIAKELLEILDEFQRSDKKIQGHLEFMDRITKKNKSEDLAAYLNTNKLGDFYVNLTKLEYGDKKLIKILQNRDVTKAETLVKKDPKYGVIIAAIEKLNRHPVLIEELPMEKRIAAEREHMECLRVVLERAMSEDLKEKQIPFFGVCKRSRRKVVNLEADADAEIEAGIIKTEINTGRKK